MLLVPAMFVLLQAARVPTFSAQVQVVGVTVSATDERTGKPVLDLKLEDFMVLENGKRQEIKYFERESVPASVLILLDTSGSMFSRQQSLRDAATRLIRSLRPVDEVHVATFDDQYHTLCDFTTDHETAVKSLGGMQPGLGTSFNLAMYTATRLLERTHRSEVGRRRVLILLSDAEDTNNSLSYEMTEDALRRSPIVCYVVHLQRELMVDSLSQELADRALRFVRSVVYETGGQLLSVRYPYDDNVIVGAFSGIATDLGSQYQLAYTSPTDSGRDGWRAVSVGMTSRSGIRLRYRRGYYVAMRR